MNLNKQDREKKLAAEKATEFIENEREGFVVSPEPKAIAESLDRLYADRERARAMGQSGKEKLSSMNLSWQHVVESLMDGAG